VSSYPARLVGEHVPKNVDRLEVRTTTRRHRALVPSTYAAVDFGVLGYTTDEHSSRLHAAEFISRAPPPLTTTPPDIPTTEQQSHPQRHVSPVTRVASA
jgi:hypothetical protein